MYLSFGHLMMMSQVHRLCSVERDGKTFKDGSK